MRTDGTFVVRFAGNSVTLFNNMRWTWAAIYFGVLISRMLEETKRFYWFEGWAEPGPGSNKIRKKSIHYLMVIARAMVRCWIRHYIAVQLLKRFRKKGHKFSNFIWVHTARDKNNVLIFFLSIFRLYLLLVHAFFPQVLSIFFIHLFILFVFPAPHLNTLAEKLMRTLNFIDIILCVALKWNNKKGPQYKFE